MRYAANQTAVFNQTLAQVLPKPLTPMAGLPPPAGPAGGGNSSQAGPPWVPVLPPAASLAPAAPPRLSQLVALAQNASVAHGAEPPSATIENLSSRLALLQQWAALEGLATGMQTVTASYLSQTVSLADASDLIKLASDTLLNIVNSFRVAAQSQALGTYAPRLQQLHSEMEQTLDRILVDLATTELAEPASASPSAAEREKACCDYAGLMAQYGIQRVLGAAGATNVAAYTVATEAAAGLVGVDGILAANATLPASANALLAATDLTAVTALAYASKVLAPPPGAAAPASFPVAGIALDPTVWADSSSALASRCAAFPCDDSITQVLARVAGETLAGSIMNLAGFILYSVSVQLDIAMELQNDSLVQLPGGTMNMGTHTVWVDALMQNYQDRARETLPLSRIASLLRAVPAASATGASAFPKILQTVLQVIGNAIQDPYGPTLAGIGAGAVPPSATLYGTLSGLRQLASAGLEQRSLAAAGTQTAASESQWQILSSLSRYAEYGVAVSNGCRTGALDLQSASTLLKDIADTLQALVYGVLTEASAVPLEVSTLYQRGAIPQLTRARAKALGLDRPAAQTRTCRDCCHRAELGNQVTAQEISRNATSIYLGAYIKALTGSIITEVLDGAALAGTPARSGAQPAQTSATPGAQAGEVQVESTDAGASSPASATPDAAGSPAPAAAHAPVELAALDPVPAEGSGPDVRAAVPDSEREAACAACACDLAFSRQLVGLAEETRSGSELTDLAYTLNLVVKALRIALLAGR